MSKISFYVVVVLALVMMTSAGILHEAVTVKAAPSADSTIDIPAGLKDKYKRPNTIPFPKDNPFSETKVDLGKTLFFETRISRSGVMSCATCHNPGLGWSDGNAKGVGDFHKVLPRKDPTILNLAWDELFFWMDEPKDLKSRL
jgi:cytochrome c peroxidase